MKTAPISCFFLVLASVLSGPILEAQSPPPATGPAIQLFDGRDFSGLAFCMKNGADPMKTWSIANGVIHCTGKPIGYLRTTQIYSNYVLTVDWRFLKVRPKADNTGVLVHIQGPDKVWPLCVQVQGRYMHQGDIFVMEGAEAKEHAGMDKNMPVRMHGKPNEKPVGQWNTCVTVCSNNVVNAFVNGKWMNRITHCSVSSGCVGIQSEGGDIEIRRMFLQPLK